MQRDNEADQQLRGIGWIVMRFWGMDIKKDLPTCVESVKEAIFQAKIDCYSKDGTDDNAN